MRAALIVVALVIVVTGALTWWLLREPTIGGSTSTPVTAVDDAPQGFKHVTRDDAEADDAGVGVIAGKVMTVERAPVPNARVQLYATESELVELLCPVCDLPVLDCGHHSTVKQIIEGIRANRFPPRQAIAEVFTDAEGNFRFDAAPLDGFVVATSGALRGESGSGEELEVMLEEPLKREVMVTDSKQEPLANIKVSLFEPSTATVRDAFTNADGQVTLTSSDPLAWAFVEHEGDLPVGRRLDELSQFTLGPPKTLVVHTLMGGKPIDAEVKMLLHRQERKFPTRDGLLRLEQLPTDYYTVTVSADGLAAAEQSVELIEPVTDLTFELRRGAKVLVTVVTPEGDPLEYVSGNLQGSDGDASADAENGALLVLGPVPEGEYTLSVTSRDRVPVTKQLDLHPGETTVEVTLRNAPRVTGVVHTADGKPANSVRVAALEGGIEVAIDFTGEDGAFSLELQYPGTCTLRAQSNRDGAAEQSITVPSESVTLTLNPRGVLEVELVDFDGKPLEPNFIVRSEVGNDVQWINADEDAPAADGKIVGRLAGLATGKYTLEREIENRVPISKTVEVVEGRTTRVQLKAERGVSIAGKVIDDQGKPVVGAVVVVSDRSEPVITDEQGKFEREGLAAGETEIWASRDDGAETERKKVKAPARDVVLKFDPMTFVTGRVVDERGTPVQAFDANDQHFTPADGRFKVQAPSKSLDVWAEGYISHYLSEATGDVGDVVLHKTPTVEGDVTDAEGKPVSGASVMGSIDQGGVVSDAMGRFKLQITSDEPQDIVATRGAMSGRVPLRVGSPAHIVMSKGTTVVGKVVDGTGKGIPSIVTAASSTAMRPQEIDTDEQGRFTVELARGVWMFSSRSFRSARAIEVQGDRMEVTIGEDAGQCGAIIHAAKPIESVWFLSRTMEKTEGPWEVVGRVPGSMEVPVLSASTTITARGIPCGHYEIAASIGSVVTSTQVDLRSPAQDVAMPLPDIELDGPTEPVPTPETPQQPSPQQPAVP